MGMGWKLATIAIPEDEMSLSALVEATYGKGHKPSATDLTVEQILIAEEPYAATYAAHHWLFDWALFADWLSEPPARVQNATVCMTQSTIDMAGFAVHRGGQLVRKRIGDAEMGIMEEAGELTNAEIRAIEVDNGEGITPEEARKAWLGQEAQTVNGDPVTASFFGETAAFEVLAEQVGFRIDSEAGLGLHESPVFRIRKQGFLQKLFG